MKRTKPNGSHAKVPPSGLEALYARALPAKRSGHLYGAFPYPTKISPEAIALFIAPHTSPGDTVFDGFAGSGTTGLAALLCEDPPDELRAEARRLGLNVRWGARNAVLYELGALGAFIGQTLSNPPDPKAFRKAAEDILRASETEDGWMYGARDPEGRDGTIRYIIWSDLLRCPACDSAMTPTWTRKRGRVYRYYTCSAAQKNGHASCPTRSISADKVEAFIVDQIRHIGADCDLQEQTFRQAVGQVKAQRRGLRRECKMLERDLATSRADVERLVGAVSRVTGPAADAVAGELEKVQGHVQTVEARLREIDDELDALKAQEVDRDDLARALEEFDPIWEVLLVPERERVLRLLVGRIDYDGRTSQMAITWRLSGFGELAAEVAP